MTYTRSLTVSSVVKVDGTELPESFMGSLKELVVESRTGGPDMVQLTFHDPDRSRLDDSRLGIGKAITVEVETMDTSGAATSGTLIAGEITAMECALGPWGTELVVRGFDKTHRLQRGRKSKAHVNVKYSDIVSSVAGDHGLTAETEATSVVHDHVLQSNETDWEFVQRLAREIGFIAGGKDGKLYFRKPSSAGSAPAPRDGEPSSGLALTADYNLVEARVTLNTSGQVPRTEVRGWDRTQKEKVAAQSSATTEMAAVSIAPGRMASTVNGKDHAVTATPYRTHDAAREAAGGVSEQIASAHAELWAVVAGHPDLAANVAVSVAGIGSRFNGRYVLSSVRHTLTAEDGYLSEVVASGARDHSLLGLAGGTDPSREGRGDRIDGVVPALVTNAKDDDGLGRVKVKFPWLDDSLESDWAPVSQIMAGNQYGALFIPEVGDEVLVAFEHGDVRAPYVVGSLYNGKDKPEKAKDDLVASDGKVKTRRLVSRTKQGMVFFDDSSQKGLRLRTGDEKFFIDLNQSDTKIVIDSNGTVEIKSKQAIDISTDANCSFDVKGDFNVKATGKVKIEGTGGVDLKSSGAMNLESQAPLGLKSSATAELSGNGPVTVKSSAILQLQGSLTKIN